METTQHSEVFDNAKARRTVLSTVLVICDRWELTDSEQIMLLGLDGDAARIAWGQGPETPELTDVQRARVIETLSIYRSLQVLLPEAALADRWMKSPNDNPMFCGFTPLSFVLLDPENNLPRVQDFLEAECVR